MKKEIKNMFCLILGLMLTITTFAQKQETQVIYDLVILNGRVMDPETMLY